jgi:hypothetical protein
VVVVLGDVLGQLEAGEPIAGGHPAHHPGPFQVGQVAVGRAAGQAWRQLFDGVDAYRTVGRSQHLDDLAPPGGVTLGTLAEPPLDHAVQHFVHHRGP